MKQKIIITSGDPSGVGPEIIVKSIQKIQKICIPIVIGSKILFEKAAKITGVSLPSDLKIVEISVPFEDTPGKLSFINGAFAGIAIKKAVDMCLKKEAKAIVTAPLNKEALQGGGYNFPGHTEFLQYLSKSPKTRMLFYSNKFSVLLHTIHIPLANVMEFITEKKLMEDIVVALADFKQTTGIAPEVMVCGLNPHAGENGKIGTEDFQISSAVSKLKSKGLNISGPYPADTLFSKVLEQKKHILVYAMYHDQGLIPIKTLFPKTSINVTLGLPFVRTSVNHGTAFDIAWKGIADETNLIEAVKTAVNFIGG